MSRLDQRVKSVELRPVSLLTSEQVGSAVDSGELFSSPESFVGSSAPNQFYKIEDAYIYPKSIGLPEDRVEIYLEADLDVVKGEILEISGIHGTQNHDIDVDGDSFVVKSLDTPPWDGRGLPNGQTKDDPTDDQRPGVSITNAYSVTPESLAPQTWNTFYRLQTKRAVDSYSIEGTTVTLVMNAVHKFKAGDVVYVDIFSEDSRAFGVDGLFEIDSVTSNTIVYTLDAGVDEPTGTIDLDPLAVYVFPVARKFSRIGSTWTNSTNNTVYYWDGLRWVTWSTDSLAPDDDDPPSPPTNVEVEGVLNVINGNYSSATVTISWTAPTTSVSGAELDDLAQYRVRWKRSDVANYGPFNIVPGNSTSFTDDGAGYAWLAGQTYNFQVQAVDSGNNPSESATATYTLPAGATIPLNQLRPSDPTTQLHLGTVAVKWDGLMSNGASAPANLSLLEFHRSLSDNFTPSDSTLIGTAAAVPNATMVFSGHTIGTTYYYRIRLRGITPGSFSLPSSAISAQTSSLVDAQRIAEIVKNADITPGTVIAGDSIIGINITGQLVEAINIRGNLIEANSITAQQIDTGSITASIVESGFITTRQFQTNSNGDLIGYNGQGITLDRNTGFAAYNSSGVPTITISNNGFVQIGGYVQTDDLAGYATTGDLSNYATVSALGAKLNANADIGAIINANLNGGQTTINGGRITTGSIDAQLLVADLVLSTLIRTGTSGPRIEIRGSSVANPGIVSFTNSGTAFRFYSNGLSYLDDVIIESGGKITAGSTVIQSGSITGGTIRTASSGKRVEMRGGSSQDIRFVDSGNTQRGAMEATTTGLSMTGSGTEVRLGGNTINIRTGGISRLTAIDTGVILGTAPTTAAAANLRRPSGSEVLAVFSSDSRIKENIVPVNEGLSVVNKLNPVTFNSKVDNTEKLFSGFLAQEVGNIFSVENFTVVTEEPGIVPDLEDADPQDFSENPLLSINHVELIAYLTKAIQELDQKNSDLENRIASLESSN